MKKLFVFICLFFASTFAFANSISNIVFFGDSLSDNGNLYSGLLHIIPKSPPYYQGRFSNGPVWADMVAGKYPASKNYAVGGATVILRSPFSGFLPYNFQEEVNSYLSQTTSYERNSALCVIWVGANDYLQGQADVLGSTTQVVNEITHEITVLINNGVQNFLILNLPDLSKTPFALNSSIIQNLHDLTVAHNQALADKIVGLKSQYPKVSFLTYDIYSTYNDMEANPDKYNMEYHTHITNTTDACWPGPYTVKKGEVNLNKDLAQLPFDSIKNIEKYIENSSALSEAYRVGRAYENDVVPCSNPDQYAFWDHVHPTTVVHLILAQMIYHDLTKAGKA